MQVFKKTDSVQQLLDIYEKYMPDAFSNGYYNRENLELVAYNLGASGRINLMVEVLSQLEIFDELLAPITIVSKNGTYTSVYADGDWGDTGATVQSEGSEITKRTFHIRGKKIGHQITISKEELMRALSASGETITTNAFISPYEVLDKAIMVAVETYRTKLRKMALTAIFYNPTSEDPTLPVLYRDTTTFATENQVIPPSRGFKTFESAYDQEHHMATATLSKDIIVEAVDKIVDKGGNANAIAIWANKKTWRKLMATLDEADLQRMVFIKDLGIEELESDFVTGAMNIQLPNTDMPDDYWIIVDMSKPLLQKKITDIDGMDGISVDFDTVGQISQVSGSEMSPEMVRASLNGNIRLANNISGGIKMTAYEVGFGVINPGGAVVLYSNGATYVAPDWKV